MAQVFKILSDAAQHPVSKLIPSGNVDFSSHAHPLVKAGFLFVSESCPVHRCPDVHSESGSSEHGSRQGLPRTDDQASGV